MIRVSIESFYSRLNNHKAGFTLIEILVVIVIMGILAGVGVPKLTGIVEKSRQEIDLLKLYNLRDALNRALLENVESLNNYTLVQPEKANEVANKLGTGGLNAKLITGVPLFILELDSGLAVNITGTHGEAPTICELIGTEGTLFNALKEGGFEDVAEIVKDRLLKGNNVSKNSPYYSVSSYTNSKGTWNRTSPKHPFFFSHALNGVGSGKTRLTMNLQWSGGNPSSHSVEVYLVKAGGAWNQAFLTDYGICFSTYGRAGCSGN